MQIGLLGIGRSPKRARELTSLFKFETCKVSINTWFITNKIENGARKLTGATSLTKSALLVIKYSFSQQPFLLISTSFEQLIVVSMSQQEVEFEEKALLTDKDLKFPPQ